MRNKLILVLICACSISFLNAQTKSLKRGACMSNLTTSDLEGLKTGLSWFYDWGTNPSTVGTQASDDRNIEYCPMTWGGNFNADAIRQYVKAHPKCKYLLTFNEPNFQSQANLTPAQAAAKWPELKALAAELNIKLISPALNYSGWAEWSTPKKWLDAFFAQPGVSINDVDGIAIHCYMGWSSSLIGYVKEYIGYYNKPIWLTEFCSWDDRSGTAADPMKLIQKEYLVDTFDFLETEPMVARYAWFMAKTGENNSIPAFPWMQLLNGNNGVLTENGKIFNNMSSYDDNFYHNTLSRIPANHYIRMKGIHLEETKDITGIINVYDFSTDDYLEYNVDVPASGNYNLFLRYSSMVEASVAVQVNGTTSSTITLSPLAKATNWATKKYTVNLNAGKQKIRLAAVQGAAIRINWLNLTTNAAAEVEGEDGGTDPVPTPVNLALSKPATASSQFNHPTNGLLAANNATDGSTSSRWGSTEQNVEYANEWLQVDLQKEETLNKIVINWEAAYAREYNVQISTDNQTWNTVKTTTDGQGGVVEITLSNLKARYIKVNCTRKVATYQSNFYGYSILELEAYGPVSTGINSLSTTGVSVYPNPATDRISIQGCDVAKVILYSLQGKELRTSNVSSLDMSGLSSGLYLVSVTDKSGDKTTLKVQIR